MRTQLTVILLLALVLLPLAAVQAQEACDPRTDYGAKVDTFAQQGQIEQALEAAECAVELNPNDGFSYLLRGYASYLYGDYDGAISDLTQAETLLPPNAFVYYYLGLAYYDSAKNREAIEQFNAMLEYAGDSPETESLLAVTYAYRAWAKANLEQFDAAIADFKQAVELEPDNAFAIIGRGAAYANLRQYQAAIADFDRLLDMLPGEDGATFKLGEVFVAVGQYSGLVTYLSTASLAIQLNPRDAEAFRERGIAHLGLGELDQAVSDFNQAIELNADDAEAYVQRAAARRLAEDYEAAIRDFTRAIEIDPDNAGYYFDRAWTHERLQNYDDAIADLTRALELSPEEDTSSNYLSRGIMYSLNGDHAEAGADYLEWVAAIETDTVAAGALALGEAAAIDMNQGSVFRFTFEAEAGQHLKISAVSARPSADVDTLIIILAPDGTPLYGKDDVVVNEDSRAIIDDFPVPDDGSYTLIVSHAGGTSQGAVSVSIEPAAAPADLT